MASSDLEWEGGGSRSADDSLFASPYAYSGAHTVTQSDSRSLTVSFANMTDGDLTGKLRMQATVYGYGYANPVPEPPSWVQMLTGLLGLGSIALRRRGIVSLASGRNWNPGRPRASDS